MHHADLVVCVGARFDDRVTGKLGRILSRAKKIHIDIDPASINKVIKVDVPMVGDWRDLLHALERNCGRSRCHPGTLDALVAGHRALAQQALAWTSPIAATRFFRSG
jgi:acetolactate synthase-1/2/3 large subunit